MIPLSQTLKTRPGFTSAVFCFVALFIFCNTTGSAETKNDKKLREITSEEFKLIMEKHQEWLNEYNTYKKRHSKKAKKDTRRANLRSANVSNSDLAFKNLTNANLKNANITNTSLMLANLTEANLSNSNLSGTILKSTKLKNAFLSNANLTNTNLLGANLFNAYLDGANLTGANLVMANLTGANLTGTNLTSVKLNELNLTRYFFPGTNMAEVIFEPKTLPNTDDIAVTRNLHKMKYNISPQMLVNLRTAFRNAGYRAQERAITFAINQGGLWRDNSLFGKLEDIFKYIFFNLPTQWGMYPGRAIRILLGGIFIFMVFYLVALQAPEPKAGIWKIRSKERVLDKDKKDKELIQPSGFWSTVVTAFYFSVLSAFHIGWRDLNVGGWVTRLQGKEYTLRATGWVRTTAGLQSLISVYLVAMWVLTYFGRPFG